MGEGVIKNHKLGRGKVAIILLQIQVEDADREYRIQGLFKSKISKFLIKIWQKQIIQRHLVCQELQRGQEIQLKKEIKKQKYIKKGMRRKNTTHVDERERARNQSR